jgi:hypothetical protein
MQRAGAHGNGVILCCGGQNYPVRERHLNGVGGVTWVGGFVTAKHGGLCSEGFSTSIFGDKLDTSGPNPES